MMGRLVLGLALLVSGDRIAVPEAPVRWRDASVWERAAFHRLIPTGARHDATLTPFVRRSLTINAQGTIDQEVVWTAPAGPPPDSVLILVWDPAGRGVGRPDSAPAFVFRQRFDPAVTSTHQQTPWPGGLSAQGYFEPGVWGYGGCVALVRGGLYSAVVCSPMAWVLRADRDSLPRVVPDRNVRPTRPPSWGPPPGGTPL